MVGIELVKDGEPDKELASVIAKRLGLGKRRMIILTERKIITDRRAIVIIIIIIIIIIIYRMSNEFMIFILTDGMDGNVLKIKPPICIDKENIDHFVSSLKQILRTY